MLAMEAGITSRSGWNASYKDRLTGSKMARLYRSAITSVRMLSVRLRAHRDRDGGWFRALFRVNQAINIVQNLSYAVSNVIQYISICFRAGHNNSFSRQMSQYRKTP